MIAELALAVCVATSAAPAIDTTATVEEAVVQEWEWQGTHLNAYMGVNFDCPQMYAETYYNMPMDDFIQFLYDLGFTGYHYVREDGVHMWHDDTGDYVMVGAYLPTYPRGTVVYTSLGIGKVFDTGYFAYGEDQIDIATIW